MPISGTLMPAPEALSERGVGARVELPALLVAPTRDRQREVVVLVGACLVVLLASVAEHGNVSLGRVGLLDAGHPRSGALGNHDLLAVNIERHAVVRTLPVVAGLGEHVRHDTNELLGTVRSLEVPPVSRVLDLLLHLLGCGGVDAVLLQLVSDAHTVYLSSSSATSTHTPGS